MTTHIKLIDKKVYQQQSVYLVKVTYSNNFSEAMKEWLPKQSVEWKRNTSNNYRNQIFDSLE